MPIINLIEYVSEVKQIYKLISLDLKIFILYTKIT